MMCRSVGCHYRQSSLLKFMYPSATKHVFVFFGMRSRSGTNTDIYCPCATVLLCGCSSVRWNSLPACLQASSSFLHTSKTTGNTWMCWKNIIFYAVVFTLGKMYEKLPYFLQHAAPQRAHPYSLIATVLQSAAPFLQLARVAGLRTPVRAIPVKSTKKEKNSPARGTSLPQI